jgi:hypothetical protein
VALDLPAVQHLGAGPPRIGVDEVLLDLAGKRLHGEHLLERALDEEERGREREVPQAPLGQSSASLHRVSA